MPRHRGDVFSRKDVGWAIEDHLRAELVLAALNAGIAQRRPKNVIHHSDHGCQYTSYGFGKRCQQMNVVPSMGAVGDAYDNAVAESFFASLEREILNRRAFKTHAEAHLAIFEWIEGLVQPASALPWFRPLVAEQLREEDQPAKACRHELASRPPKRVKSNSVAGRYAQSDPVGLFGGVGTFVYSNGDPLGNIDPLGLWWFGDPLPQTFVDVWTGAADSVSFGFGPRARRSLGVDGGVDRCSAAYKAGDYGTLALGAGRLVYAGGARAISLFAATGRQAVAGRNILKRVFRGPFFWLNYKTYPYEKMLAEKGTDEAVRAAAGRTSEFWNQAGVSAASDALANDEECGCR